MKDLASIHTLELGAAFMDVKEEKEWISRTKKYVLSEGNNG